MRREDLSFHNATFGQSSVDDNNWDTSMDQKKKNAQSHITTNKDKGSLGWAEAKISNTRR